MKRSLLILLTALLAACSSVPSYDGPSGKVAPATLTGKGSMMNLCSVGSMISLTPQVCLVRLELLDGKRVGFWSSAVEMDPGTHTLYVMCQAYLLGDTRIFFQNISASFESGKKYHLEGEWRQGCAISVIDDKTGQSIAGPPASQRLAPGTLYSGKLLAVHSPDSEGWSLVNSSGSGVAFARPGVEANESYAASASLFELPDTKTPQEFTDFIKASLAKDLSADRFTPLSADYAYGEEHGYPCVKYTGTVKDTQSQTASGTESLLLQVKSLYCRHPQQAQAGFVVAFSHRGSSLDPNMDARAESFFRGVQAVK